jgi:hypothetical protein
MFTFTFTFTFPFFLVHCQKTQTPMCSFTEYLSSYRNSSIYATPVFKERVKLHTQFLPSLLSFLLCHPHNNPHPSRHLS